MPYTDDQIREQMYEDLKRQYDLTSDRRKTLTSQASSLLGFAGIIETILIATVVALGTDGDIRSLIIGSVYHFHIIVTSSIGFIAYIFAVGFSLFALIEPKWISAPQFPVVYNKSLANSVKDYWITAPQEYKRMDAAIQLADGLKYDQKINNIKFDLIRIASALLVAGIVLSAVTGIMFLDSAL